ncbi:hypothetical protein AAMO2058_000861000 [Amorphochlora amoebiformis]
MSRRELGAEKCLRLLKADEEFLKRYNVTKATRFGLDGKLSRSLFVYVKTKEDAKRLPKNYPLSNGKPVVPVVETSKPPASSEKPTAVVRATSVGKTRPTSNLSKQNAPEETRVISGSRRKDGTVRKDVVIRAGFKSEELDISTYKSREALAEAERRKRAKGYIPGAPVHLQRVHEHKTAAEKRAEKRRAQRARKREEKARAKTSETKSVKEEQKASPKPNDVENSQPPAPEAPEQDTQKISKKLRSITKKLRQIEQIKAKVKAGEALNQAQKEKISRECELVKEMEGLKIILGQN